MAATASLVVESGGDAITEYESSTNRRKCFCARCGSQLFIRRGDRPEWTAVALGAIDGEPDVRPERHVFTGSKASWFAICDALPQYKVYPGFEPEQEEAPRKVDSLGRQLTFLKEIDRLKSVIRQSPLLDRSRRENSAEHSWHLAMYAWVLHGYACGPVNVTRVIQMLLLHDVVEIDVGDTPLHGSTSRETQRERETAAAERLFGLVPPHQGAEMLALWEEFEAAATEDAKFAKALDRFQPLLVNILTEGGTWAESGVSREQVLSRYGPTIRAGAPKLWDICEQWVEQHFAQR